MLERDPEAERVYDAGSVHFHRAGEPHSGRIGGRGAVCLSITAGPEISRRLESGPAHPPSGPLAAAVASIGRRCHVEFGARDEASDLALEALSLELVAEVMRSRDPGSSRMPRWLFEVRDYLNAHFRERIPLATLAAVAGVHEVHLVRSFRRHFRRTPGAYVRMLRIESARRAMVETPVALADLALESGFTSQSHFTREFSRQLGITPAAYRRSHAR